MINEEMRKRQEVEYYRQLAIDKILEWASKNCPEDVKELCKKAIDKKAEFDINATKEEEKEAKK